MKATITLVLLLAATPALAQSNAQNGSYGYGQGSPGATMQDYKLGPHHRVIHKRKHAAVKH